jgi:ribulose-phosphate 3-epimerase
MVVLLTKTQKQLVEAGADVLVAGSVFKAADPIATIADLKKLTTI